MCGPGYQSSKFCWVLMLRNWGWFFKVSLPGPLPIISPPQSIHWSADLPSLFLCKIIQTEKTFHSLGKLTAYCCLLWWRLIAGSAGALQDLDLIFLQLCLIYILSLNSTWRQNKGINIEENSESAELCKNPATPGLPFSLASHILKEISAVAT